MAMVEDAFLTECSARYPPDVMQKKYLEDTHTVIHIVFGPEDWGHPARRRRSLSAGINNASLVWVGPTAATAVQNAFNTLFRRTCEMTGDDLFMATDREVFEWVEERSSKRSWGRPLPSNYKELPMSEYLGALVPPSGLRHLAINEKLREEQGSLNGVYLCDIEQTPHRGTTPGSLVPSLSTHSLIYSFKKQRLATASEWFGIQGVDAHSKFWGSRGRSPLLASVAGMDEATVRALLGNALYVPVFAAWFLFIMGNCVRRETPTPSADAVLRRTVSVGRDDESENE